MSRRLPKIDRRLIGAWQSDRRRTFKCDTPKRGASQSAIRKLKALFGKLKLRYGFRQFTAEFDGFRTVSKYTVIAQDSESVVIRIFDDLLDRTRLVQIHFEDDGYWIWTLGQMREYFKRIKRKA